MRILSCRNGKQRDPTCFSFPANICLQMIKMEIAKLSNRIRIVSNHKKVECCPEHHLTFYAGYAEVVSETLKKPLFQRFLDWVIKREDIAKKDVTDIQVRLFPFQKENGKYVAGRCNNQGVIRIFPKKRSFLQKKMQKHNKQKIHSYLKSRAMATLIHEILHVKYEGDERKVRQLTRKYFGIFARCKNPEVQNMFSAQKMLFAV